MKDIVMPKLSDTMTEGRLVSWKKSVGEAVRRGEVIAEVETDKANMELEAFANGVLLEIRIPAGETAAVGTVIGVIGAAGEKGSAPPEEKKAQKSEPAKQEESPKQAEPAPQGEPDQKAPAQKGEPTKGPAAPEGIPAPESTNAPFTPEEAGKDQESVGDSGGTVKPPPSEEPKPKAEPVPTAGHFEERAAPVVRRRARELEVDLALVKGSGPDGRILLDDLEAFAAGAPAEKGRGEGPLPEAKLSQQMQPLSRFRAAIARTVVQSWREAPQFSATIEVFMDQVKGLRQDLKGAGQSVSTNDVIVKAAALALKKFPLVNGSFAGDALRLNGEINIGIVVGLPDAILIPVITGCGERSLTDIASESKRLVDRARAGQLTEEEMMGGTFTISNLGMYGVARFNAILFPPQAAVLAVGAVVDRVVAQKGVPTVAKVMELTLSADHRILDGVYVAQFLSELKGMLEHPTRLVL